MKSSIKAFLFVAFVFCVMFAVDKTFADDPENENQACTIDCSININSATYYVSSDFFEFDVTWDVTGCTEGFECEIFFYVNSPGNQMCYRVMTIYVTQTGSLTVPIGFIWSESEAPPLEMGDILCAEMEITCNAHNVTKTDSDEETITFSY